MTEQLYYRYISKNMPEAEVAHGHFMKTNKTQNLYTKY